MTAIVRSTLLASALALSVLGIAGCSGGGSEADAGQTTTTDAPPTTVAPLVEGAEEYGLAYLSADAEQTTIFLTDGKGTKTEPVARLEGRAEVLRWSPDGARLLLDGDATGEFELSIVDVGSGEVTSLASSPSSSEGGGAWSPDGEEVAFFSNRDGGFAGYVVDVGSGAVRRVTPPEATGVAELTWSPDGSLLAFSTSDELASDVWTVRPDGTEATKVSTVPGSTQPAWSPDGRQLAMSAQAASDESAAIYVLDLAEGTSSLVGDTPHRDAFPVWAPSGDELYFIAAVPNEDADGGAADDIYRIEVGSPDDDAAEPEPVIADGISVESELEVTSDGRLIVFSVARLRDKEVFVANADGSGAIPVSRSERTDSWGAWRPGTGPGVEPEVGAEG